MSTLSSWDLSEGETIAEDLTAMKLLGGGNAYQAYLAFDEQTYAPVVVKVLRPDEVEDSSSLRGLHREAAALAAVNHPVVVRGLRHADAGPRPHLVLEHVDGPRLSSLIRRYGPLTEQQYLPLAIDVASALHYLGRLGWTHLDVKPSNIIMGAPARLIDLSVARTVEDAARLRVPIGTDAYMAPEQAAPGEYGEPGPASDVWGLGATLFHAVTGRRPFAAGDLNSTELTQQYPQLLDEPGAVADTVPAEVVEVVLAMLAKDPAKRPAPAEVSDALAPVLARQPVGRLTFKVR
ncbi:MAG: serine/threonine-protein kinase [Nocardioides sp.]|uniref:serine/threonine-protein kinase n=1 Tax=Nocardioides sp. TaxID=35761 RepID=UPI003F0D9D72